MPDLLVRGLPESVVLAIDAHARRLGLSRSEYVRRRLTQEGQRVTDAVSVADLSRFTEDFGDLVDDSVMTGAWE